MSEFDPYRPPVTDLPAPPEAAASSSDERAEIIRRAHLNHETSIKALGTLFYLGCVLLFVYVISLIVGVGHMAELQPKAFHPAGGMVGFGLVLVVLSIAQGVTGWGLRRLRRWVMIPAGVLCGIGLLSFPLGTLLNAYFLYLLFSTKGRMVLSEQYQQVVAQTTHIKYKTSIVVWIFLALIVALVVAGIVAQIG